MNAAKELKKFMKLSVEQPQLTHEMFSKFVDKEWHRLESSDEYQDFCVDACGHLVEHLPEGGYGPISWIKRYEAKFGQLPPVWFMDESGHLDKELYEKYRNTGEVVASWDCTPGASTRTR